MSEGSGTTNVTSTLFLPQMQQLLNFRVNRAQPLNPGPARDVYTGRGAGLFVRHSSCSAVGVRGRSTPSKPRLFRGVVMVMRVVSRFCVRSMLAAQVIAGGLSVFGVAPVRAQTPALAAQGGGAQSDVRRISVDEAVALALENNLDLQVDRITPQVQDLTVAQARTGYTPVFQSNINWNDQTQPPVSLLAGNASQVVGNNANYNFGLGGFNKWGGNYGLGWNNARATTNNLFTNFNPQFATNISANYTQPLLRNFKIDGTRQQLLVSQKNREISDVQVRQSIALTTRNVRNAYYDLTYAIGNLNVQRQSLELAEQSLKDNRARVEIGTMAPIDIVQAEAEVAQREESVILAEAAISRFEDRLRALVFDPSSPDFWRFRIEPTEQVQFQPHPVDTEGAVANALKNRTDLNQSRKQLEANDVNIRFFKNQSLPDVSASLTYFAQAIGGTGFLRGEGFPGPIVGEVQKSYASTLGTMFAGDFPTWTFQMQISYPIGQATAEAQLARARLQDQQSRKQLQSQELQVATQIREFARQVQTNTKRVEATRASRVLAERRLEAEEKKFQAGMTTAFLVFQAQRDLNQARNNELQALVDYVKSTVDFEASQETPLQGIGGTSTVTTGGVTTGITGTTTGTGTTTPQRQQ
jgi:outer membrane protein TolC